MQPLVNQIASDLLNLGYQPGIILRGYGGKFIGTKLVDDLTTAKEVGDELYSTSIVASLSLSTEIELELCLSWKEILSVT